MTAVQPTTAAPSILGDPAVSGQPLVAQGVGRWAPRSRRWRCGWRGPRRRCRGTTGRSAVGHRPGGTSPGRSSGQHGARGQRAHDDVGGVREAGAARRVDRDDAMRCRPCRPRTNPTSASRRTWWEQVDWLIPSSTARSPTRRCRRGGGHRVQQADPGRVGQGREPLGVGRRGPGRDRRSAQAGSGQAVVVVATARGRSTRVSEHLTSIMRSMVAFIDIDRYVRSIDRTSIN